MRSSRRAASGNTSRRADPYGFTASAYTATGDAAAVKWVTDATSPTEGLNHWTGTVKGEAVDGALVWTKAGQATITYTFVGTLKK